MTWSLPGERDALSNFVFWMHGVCATDAALRYRTRIVLRLLVVTANEPAIQSRGPCPAAASAITPLRRPGLGGAQTPSAAIVRPGGSRRGIPGRAPSGSPTPSWDPQGGCVRSRRRRAIVGPLPYRGTKKPRRQKRSHQRSNLRWSALRR